MTVPETSAPAGQAPPEDDIIAEIVAAVEWPQIEPGDPHAEVKKLLYQAKLDLVKKQYEMAFQELADDVEREKAERAHHHALHQVVYTAYVETARAEAERATGRAEFVQKAAAAIATAYTAVVGLTFGLGTGNAALPGRGVAPTLFLGLAIFLATAYVAYLSPEEAEIPEISEPQTSGMLRSAQRAYRNNFIRWTSAISQRRKYLLQASVISLGLGILFLPAPYLVLPNNAVAALALIGLLLVAAGPRAVAWVDSRSVQDEPEP